MDRSKSIRCLAPLTLLAATLLLTAAAPAPAPAPDEAAAAAAPSPRWLAKLEGIDRELLTELVGHAPPAFTDDLTWTGSPALTWSDLRGKVVVLQSWTGGNAMGRGAQDRVVRLLDDTDAGDVAVVLVHTPENADKAGRFLEQRPSARPVVIDSRGAFCDAVGFYKKPANLIVDRNGTVRYVGLNSRGLKEAVAQLVAETHDPAKKPVPAGTSASDVAETKVERPPFPPIAGSVGKAQDLRGKPGPEVTVSKWITPKPELKNKVIVVDFWATWCGPCVRSIPHMNDLARKFEGSAEVIGVSNEKPADFDRGMQRLARQRITAKSFQYAIALDEYRSMGSRVRNQTIPHAIVMSTDGIVRWQGHPGGLNERTLEAIIRADPGVGGGEGDARIARRKRWTR